MIERNLGNLPPQVGVPLPDMDVRAGEISQFELDEDTFFDPDEGDALKYLAYQHFDGELPRWIRFDPFHRRFEFHPPAGAEGTVEIRVVAKDFDGAEANLTFKVNYR